MKKEYEKPYIYTVEINESENIAEGGTSVLGCTTVQDGSTNAYGIISYNALKY